MSAFAPVSIELFVDGGSEVRGRDAEASGAREEVAHESPGFGGAIAFASVGGDVLDESARALSGRDQAFILEIAVGLNHRRRIDAQLRGERANGGERFARGKLARGDAHPDSGGDLRVQRRGTTGLDMIEHETVLV